MQRRRRRRGLWLTVVGVVAVLVAVVGVGVLLADHRPARPLTVLPTAPASYLGLYVPGSPASYVGVSSFTGATGVRPNVVSYYSGWYEPFQTGFAQAAAEHHAVPLVQIDPTNISLAAIAAGHYDQYLTAYAKAVRAYRLAVVLSFGHEMNGDWFSWGFKHASPTAFVAAWRHIVEIFRVAGARNVTWMWTVNSVYTKHDMIPDPAAWWPGSSYVNWVGIDGYFHQASSQFASVFGPTIIDVRELTKDPILISETGARPDTEQAAKIASLFAGVRSYRLLGFLWFDSVGNADYRIVDHASIAAFRLGAKTNGLG
jgi:mannan endo-1,4-beta-mannosidase